MTSDGSEFEALVRATLRLIPGSRVSDHVRLAGKEVDIVCELDHPLGEPQILAIECKDNSSRLSRKIVSQILADYRPVIDGRSAHSFFLITKSGIVANARAGFTAPSFQHLTYEELLHRVLRPGQLLRNMRQQFLADGLSAYYVPSTCFNINVSWVSRHYDQVYSDFVDFSIQLGSRFEAARREWHKLTAGMDEATQPESYTAGQFDAVVAQRTSSDRTALERLVLSWLSDPTTERPLALIGSYGTGKSSFCRRIAAHCAESFENGSSQRLPILIELRELGQHQDIRTLILAELINRHRLTTWSYATFQSLNHDGRLFLILDGFDEMKQGLSRDALLFNFDQINALHTPKSKVLLCGRPTAFASEDEQTLILAGRERSQMSNRTGYVQVRLAPFTADESMQFLRLYFRVKGNASDRTIAAKLANLARILEVDEAVQELLSRPVHLPMLATILPSIEVTRQNLSRACVYAKFIDTIIAREVMRRGRDQTGLSIDDRRQFAEELAICMLSSGETRSIRYGAIPGSLVAAFARDERDNDELKRDLLSACFLERKPPDILFFPHKSFAEFLAARAIVRRLEASDPVTLGMTRVLSVEVFSFVRELARPVHWRAAALHADRNSELIRHMLTCAGSESDRGAMMLGVFSEPRVVAGMSAALTQLPRLVVFLIIRMWMTRLLSTLGGDVAGVVRASLERLAACDDGAIGLLSRRALLSMVPAQASTREFPAVVASIKTSGSGTELAPGIETGRRGQGAECAAAELNAVAQIHSLIGAMLVARLRGAAMHRRHR